MSKPRAKSCGDFGLYAKCTELLRRFRSEATGNVAMLYAICLVPTIGAAGAAIDLGQAVVVRQRLGEALDSAALAVGTMPSLSDSQRLAKVQQFFDANYPAGALGDTHTIQVSTTEQTVTLHASASVDTAFLGLLGIPSLTVANEVEVTRENKGMEIALVLDNTGSMAQSGKLTALKQASTDLVNILFAGQENPQKVKISLVPFGMTVRLNTQAATAGGWMDTNGNALWARLHFNNNMHPYSVWNSMAVSSPKWAGCVEARPNGLEELDTPPTAADPNSRWVPFFQPDEPDSSAFSGYSNSYLTDGVANGSTAQQRLMNSAKYATKNNNGPNTGCTMQSIQPLTNSKTTLLNQINGMQATGLTHIAIGAGWGWRTLSPGAPYTEGSQYGDVNWQKAMVLMTDGINTVQGNNTAYKSTYTAYGYLSEGRLGTTNANTAVTNQDTRVGQVCTRMKQLGIRIYTILLMENDTTTVNMMRACATSPDLYFNSPSASQLQGVFQAIANDLSNLRISR